MKMKLTVLASLGILALGAYACSGDNSSEIGEDDGSGASSPGSGGSGPGSGGNSNSTGVGGSFQSVGGSGGQGTGGACNDVVVPAQSDVLPADIIFVIDNSGSMSQEIDAVEQNINVNFAQIMSAAMLDYQVIMLTDHGDTYTSGSYPVCIGPPLSGTTNCSNSSPPVENNTFHHYDLKVFSVDSACKFLDTMYGSTTNPDEFGNYPNGWASLLRQTAKKFIIEITDDRMYCQWNGSQMYDNQTTTQYPQPGQAAAIEFDKLVLQQAPAQFGTTAQRNYIFYSLVGVEPNPVAPTQPYDAAHPYISNKCSTAVNSGAGYQWLSKGTGGWRFPVCNIQDYGPIFQKIAEDVIFTTSVPCEIDLPEPPMGQTYDLSKVEVLYTPDANSPPESFTQVASAAACNVDDDKFYIENGKIILCPAACTKVSANKDGDAEVQVKIQCGFVPE